MTRKEILKIGNAQAFWGDCPEAPARLIRLQPDLNYLTLDYLAEVSLSILAIQREKEPGAGFAQDFIGVIRSLIPLWKQGCRTKVVANAGGLNPHACALACQKELKASGVDLKIGIVSGDDVLDKLHEGNNLENGEPLSSVKDRLVTANAYLGAAPIAEALRLGAHIVITGRVADPSLTVGPCLVHFNWKQDDFDRIAGATVAGHLIECGTQATGGISTNWLQISNPGQIGFPIAEVSEEGACVITKPLDTGGKVNQWTIKEQLLYEIGDPSHYLSPDATVSFLGLTVAEEGKGEDRVRITGAIGSAPPASYKVSATFRDGFKAEAMLGIFGEDAAIKGRRCGEIILQKVKEAGYVIQRSVIECLGCGDIVSGVFPKLAHGQLECVLRVCVADQRKEAVECFTKEIAALVTCGPQGVCGYTSGRPKVRPIFGYWPCLIPVTSVLPKVNIL